MSKQVWGVSFLSASGELGVEVFGCPGNAEEFALSIRETGGKAVVQEFTCHF